LSYLIKFASLKLAYISAICLKIAIKKSFIALGKKNMPTIFRLGARAISTCLVLLAATWQLIGK
jgi:hypothetical protein